MLWLPRDNELLGDLRMFFTSGLSATHSAVRDSKTGLSYKIVLEIITVKCMRCLECSGVLLKCQVLSFGYVVFAMLFLFVLKTNSNTQCSVSSEDIEKSFRMNPQGSVSFTTTKFNYRLDFSGKSLFCVFGFGAVGARFIEGGATGRKQPALAA